MNRRRHIVPLTLLVLACAVIGGCTGLAWLANAFAPPKEVPAVFELEPTGKVLVLVDDMGKPVRYERIKRLLTEKINRLLMENEAAEKVVSYGDVFRFIASRNNFNRMGVADVARELGATQTIYVYLDEFSLKDDPGISLWSGKLGVLVRVVDMEGATKWPIERPAGHRPKLATSPQVDDTSPTRGEKIAIELADKMAARVAKLFYKHSETRGFNPDTNFAEEK